MRIAGQLRQQLILDPPVIDDEGRHPAILLVAVSRQLRRPGKPINGDQQPGPLAGHVVAATYQLVPPPGLAISGGMLASQKPTRGLPSSATIPTSRSPQPLTTHW